MVETNSRSNKSGVLGPRLSTLTPQYLVGGRGKPIQNMVFLFMDALRAS